MLSRAVLWIGFDRQQHMAMEVTKTCGRAALYCQKKKKRKDEKVSLHSWEERDRLGLLSQMRCQILSAVADRGQQTKLQTTATQRCYCCERGERVTDSGAKSLCRGEADGWSLGH